MQKHPSGLFTINYISAVRGCCRLKFLHTLQPPKLYFQSDLGCRAASSWALPHISSWQFAAWLPRNIALCCCEWYSHFGLLLFDIASSICRSIPVKNIYTITWQHVWTNASFVPEIIQPYTVPLTQDFPSNYTMSPPQKMSNFIVSCNFILP